MSDSVLYRPFDIVRRLRTEVAVIYRCVEVLPGRGFMVQSADRVYLPVDRELLRRHEQQFWELFCEEAPEVRSGLFATVEQAIASFDADFNIEH
ncbi:hypothetical protein [Myxococcus qinghaiensis]|uniref:hypothetical protein n=1 Tax=Myxococcus qinghaiensis TaxID=2906758 RepID=UPI0020A719E1|nr:hypothetical protein [Myxococcus qinghaiensis]MCP3167130.1 hypothetical protein [Myxococcus qinghaiensis]